MNRLGLPFSCVSPGVDETPAALEKAVSLVARLAKAKAAAVADKHPSAWVIGSDQVAARPDPGSGEQILGKPGTEAACVAQLSACSGQTLSFLTAVAIVKQGQAACEFIDTTRVTFRVLEPAAIERYVQREMPIDCAGGFKSEALGITLCESIDSTDPTALIGLPLIRLSAALRSLGYELP
jgi:septum formation protein